MAQILEIHPTHPQQRLLQQAVRVLQDGGIIVYPTDSAYALGCMLGNREAKERIRQIRDLPPEHNFTLVCRDLSEIATYAYVDNTAFRLLKANTPGPYTFILSGTRDVPKRFLNPKRKTIGLRIPDNKVAQLLLQALNAPLLSVSLILPDEDLPFSTVYDVEERLARRVDLIIDAGACELEPTTVVDLTGDAPVIIRAGRGAVEPFL